MDLESAVSFLLKLCLYACVLSGLYLLWGAFFGGLGDLGGRLSAADQHRVLANVRLATKVFVGTGLVAGVLLGTRLYRDPEFLAGTVLAGAVLGIGVPYLLVPSELSSLIGTGALRQGAGQPLGLIAFAFRHLGLFLLAQGVALWAYDTFVRARNSQRQARVSPKVKAAFAPMPVRTIYARCWETPHRRSELCQNCHVLKRRKPCWKLQSGCYCDVTVMLGIDPAQAASRGRVDGIPLGPPQSRKRMISCGECPIYLFHQRQKYRLAVPVVLALGALALVALLPQLNSLYDGLITSVDRMAAHLSFGAPSAGGSPTLSALDHLGMRWLLGLSVSALFIAYLIQGVDYVLFKLKL